MLVNLLLQTSLWVSLLWVTPQTTATQPPIPLGTNPLKCR